MSTIRTGKPFVWLTFCLLVLLVVNSASAAPLNAALLAQQANTPVPPDQAQLGLEEFGFTLDELVVKVDATEALIAECMQDAGFEYVAVDFNTVRRGMLADKALPGLTQPEFKALYGFGISTLYADVDVPQLASDFVPAKIGLGEQNVAIWLGLSPTDQIAYNHTLLGDNLAATFAVSLEAEDFSQIGGCTRTAIKSVFPIDELSPRTANPLDYVQSQDPRMIAAVQQYADCIHTAGYDYSSPEELEPDIEDRFEEITGGVALGKLSDEAKAALAELQDEERALAVASWNCEHTYIHPVQDELRGQPQDQQ